jgi:hypothetical protein
MATLEERLEALESEADGWLIAPGIAWHLAVLAVLMACAPFLLLSLMTDRDLRIGCSNN